MPPCGDPERARCLAAADCYVRLRDLAIALHPKDFEAAFRALCAFARTVEPANADLGADGDAYALHVLATLDVDAFFRRWPPDDDRDPGWPTPRAPAPPACELEPA